MLRALVASGLSGRAFAARHGVAYHRVSYWRSKQRADSAQPVESGGFTEAVVVGGNHALEASARVDVELRNGRRLMFRGDWSELDLQRWLRAVEGL
jgi:hypothetical protein